MTSSDHNDESISTDESSLGSDATAADSADGDRFVVAIHRTESELEFAVRVPSDIDSGWRNPTAFQQLVEQRTWERLDQPSTLRAIAARTEPGETVTLGAITLTPDGSVVDHSLAAPAEDDTR